MDLKSHCGKTDIFPSHTPSIKTHLAELHLYVTLEEQSRQKDTDIDFLILILERRWIQILCKMFSDNTVKTGSLFKC